jgi:type I restriction enzyme S subunit
MTALSKKTTGVDSIAFADVKKIPVPVPSLKEQERIVKLLDEADELRKLRAQADRRTAALIHALFHEIFGDSLNNSTGLEIKELRSVCIIGDGNHSSNYPKASEMLSSGIPFIRAVNLQDGKLDVADMRYISQEKHLKLKKGHLKSGDVLFSNRGEIGKLAIVPDEFDNSNLNSQLAWLRPGEAILSQYLFSLLSSAGYQAGFRRSQQGAALQQFTIKQLSAIKVPIPPMPLQQEFAQRVSEIRELETAQAASRQRVEHLFQSMQHRAFNQEL